MQVDCLDRSIGDEIVARRMEQNNLLLARNVASDKSYSKVSSYWVQVINVKGGGGGDM